MAVLVAAVVLVGVLGVVNLLFCFGIVRRLREHTEILNGMSGGSALILAAGETVGDFTGVSLGGTVVSREAIAAPTLVAFLSPGCGPCEAELPAFLDAARAYPAGNVVAVVCGGDDTAAAPVVDAVGTVAQVLREADSGPVQEAFAVRGYPSFALLEPGGLVRAAELRVGSLPAPATA
jgi:thiol-disulfide isomerase/thioredoxin